MARSPVDLDAWMRRRVGYGTLSADYWFIGMEERADDPLAEFESRTAGPELEDIYEAHQRMGAKFDSLFTSPVLIQPTLRGPIIALLAAEGLPRSSRDIANYQATVLGRAAGRTLLAEMLPLAAPSIGEWPYKSLAGVPYLASRDLYRQTLAPIRVALLRDLLIQRRPRVALGYGKGYWAHYAQVLAAEHDPWNLVSVDDHEDWFRWRVDGAGDATVVRLLCVHPRATGDAYWVATGQAIRALLAGQRDPTAIVNLFPASDGPDGIALDELLLHAGHLGYVISKNKAWYRLDLPGHGNRVYLDIQPNSRSSKMHLSGFRIAHSLVRSISADEAERNHIGRVRGEARLNEATIQEAKDLLDAATVGLRATTTPPP